MIKNSYFFKKVQLTIMAFSIVIVMCSASWAATYYIDATNGNDGNSGTLFDPFKNISKGLDIVSAGDTIRLLPGTYYGPLVITKSGNPEQPIIIISDSSDPASYAVIDGGGTYGDVTNHGIFISSSSWIVIQNLKFQNCWKHSIHGYNSNYITVKGCISVGGEGFYSGPGSGSHHILIEGCYWEQDSRLWTTWGWHASHDSLWNGSFFDDRSAGNSGNWQGMGASVIRNNHIKYVYNGIQLWAEAQNNMANMEIYNNLFEYVTDNAIEPERFTFNLHVYHNKFNQVASGIFSFTGAVNSGGPIYVYGNVGYYDTGDPFTGSDYVTLPRSYRVFKMEEGTDYTEDTFYIVHNSWAYRSWNDSKNFNKHLRHYNNIGLFTLGYKMINWQFAAWDNIFDYDFSNKTWPSSIVSGNQETHGIVAEDPGFINLATVDFRLQNGTPCIDKGMIIPGFTQSYEELAPDIGAYEGNRLVEGPPFYIMEPPGGLGYNEKPRITRHRVSGSQLQLFFSWPLNPLTVTKQAVILTADGSLVTVENVKMSMTNREVIINTYSNLENKKLNLLFNPLPEGDNGEIATLWASTVGETTNILVTSATSAPSAPSNLQIKRLN